MENYEEQWLKSLEGMGGYHRWFFDHISSYLNGNVWEVGAGVGTFSQYMLDKNLLVMTEIVDEYLECLRAKYGKQENVKIHKFDLLKPNYEAFPEYHIDTAVSINVLDHIENDMEAIRRVYHVLQKNGVFVLVLPNHNFLYNNLDFYANHYRRYSKQQVNFLLDKAGFKVEKIFTFNLLGAFAWYWNGKIKGLRVVPKKNIDQYDKLIWLAKLADFISSPLDVGNTIVAIGHK